MCGYVGNYTEWMVKHRPPRSPSWPPRSPSSLNANLTTGIENRFYKSTFSRFYCDIISQHTIKISPATSFQLILNPVLNLFILLLARNEQKLNVLRHDNCSAHMSVLAVYFNAGTLLLFLGSQLIMIIWYSKSPGNISGNQVSLWLVFSYIVSFTNQESAAYQQTNRKYRRCI